MDKINFTGGFSLVKPNSEALSKIFNEILPDIRYSSANIPNKGEIFFAVNDKYDNEVATYLFTNKYIFNYYPNINMKSGLQNSSENQVINIVRGAKVISDPSKIKKAVQETDKKCIPEGYKGSSYDYWDKTINALRTIEYISVRDLKPVPKPNLVTEFRDNSDRLVAVASPNNTRGYNFIIVFPRYSDENMEMLKVSPNGGICYRTRDVSVHRPFKRDFRGAVLTAPQ